MVAINVEYHGGGWVSCFAVDEVQCVLCKYPSQTHLCGYVVVPAGHPWHGKDLYAGLDSEVLNQLDVHGGVTFSDSPGEWLLEVARLNKEDWLVGFDTNHGSDWDCPKSAEYCYDQLKNLVKQLHKDGGS